MPRTVSLNANPLLEKRLSATRSRLLLAGLAAAFLVLAVRAVWLQVWTDEYLQRQGEVRYGRTLELPASRGKILDRHGAVLASSLPSRAIFAIPGEVKATPQQIAQLAKLLELSPAELERRIGQPERTFVYLKRQVEGDVAERIEAMRIAGIHQRNEYKRHYPEGEALAHVVGFTNVEDLGQEGIELASNEVLSGQVGSRRVIKDRLGRIVEDVGAVREPHDGRDIALSIDAKIQYLAFEALREAVREHRAKAAAAVVLDARSGEILALVNLPTYNPNARGQLSGAQLRNRAITDTFEPGSTMKPFVVGLALDQRQVTPATPIQTAPGRMTIGSATIGDVKHYGVLTVEQVLQKSSNVGTVKLALAMSPQSLWELYTGLGFGQAPQVGFPGAVAGRVRPYRNWKPIEQATMSYGHGISVSLLQMARAYTVFARDGEIVPLSMTRAVEPAAGTAVFSPTTARAVRHMLELAAGPEGTAPLAQVPGYRVGGKTGTAHKQEGGRYVDRYIASFVGIAPISDPRIVVAVMVDEPSAGKYYGGQVAAPVFSRIAREALASLRVAPDAPMANVIIPAEPVQESL